MTKPNVQVAITTRHVAVRADALLTPQEARALAEHILRGADLVDGRNPAEPTLRLPTFDAPGHAPGEE